MLDHLYFQILLKFETNIYDKFYKHTIYAYSNKNEILPGHEINLGDAKFIIVQYIIVNVFCSLFFKS